MSEEVQETILDWLLELLPNGGQKEASAGLLKGSTAAGRRASKDRAHIATAVLFVVAAIGLVGLIVSGIFLRDDGATSANLNASLQAETAAAPSLAAAETPNRDRATAQPSRQGSPSSSSPDASEPRSAPAPQRQTNRQAAGARESASRAHTTENDTAPPLPGAGGSPQGLPQQSQNRRGDLDDSPVSQITQIAQERVTSSNALASTCCYKLVEGQTSVVMRELPHQQAALLPEGLAPSDRFPVARCTTSVRSGWQASPASLGNRWCEVSLDQSSGWVWGALITSAQDEPRSAQSPISTAQPSADSRPQHNNRAPQPQSPQSTAQASADPITHEAAPDNPTAIDQQSPTSQDMVIMREEQVLRRPSESTINRLIANEIQSTRLRINAASIQNEDVILYCRINHNGILESCIANQYEGQLSRDIALSLYPHYRFDVRGIEFDELGAANVLFPINISYP